MNVDTPLWLLLTASAFGGAVLTGIITLGTKFVELRHRHDETRRDHYVTLLATFDDFQQALFDAYGDWNSGPSKAVAGWSQKELARQAAGEEDSRRHALFLAAVAARRAHQTVLLFAPLRVADLSQEVLDTLWESHNLIDRADDALTATPSVQPAQLPWPTFPQDTWRALRQAIRRDLGVRGRVD